ncbi:MAG: hypothetical protein V2I66_08625 [Halieaceae bacterium]|jgi:hypothetical protein|nr:hypothetical protein [Halieaceae bacterium]
MNPSEEFLALLRCPVTGGALTQAGAELHSADGEHEYPLIRGIPWLLPHPRNSLLDWGAKLNHFRQVLAAEADGLERELKSAPAASQARLAQLRDAKRAFLAGVTDLVTPIASARVAEKSLYDVLRDRAPSTQNLLSYEANLYRDWIWGDEENQRNCKLVLDQLGETGVSRLLVLGAGSARLAYDLHTALQPGLTVATDINPLLLLAAERVFSGAGFSLHEFPPQPRDSGSVAIEQSFEGLGEWPAGLQLAFADVARNAFEPGAFDAVVTPWLIDIQPHELSRFLTDLNQYLPIGGHWVNFGSLVFNQRRDAFCYTVEEVAEIAADCGFAVNEPVETELPYLRSPHNAGYRMERVWAWRSEKTADVAAREDAQVLPGWVLDTDKPIPRVRYFDDFARAHRVNGELAAEVDGKTSIAAIAGRLAKQNNMDRAEALQLVRNFFLEIYRANNPGA